jgi:type VI secretion system protein ImpL
MEALRAQLETLLDYDRNGAPWKMRWGLYAGSRVLPATQHLYFERFREVFLGEIETSLEQTLARLPAVPDAENSYNATYDRLKAYRMITQCKCAPDPSFLTGVLSQTWLSGRAIDDTRRTLAEKQIAFYAEELKKANPYSIQESPEVVSRAQRYLASIGGVDRLYRNIIEEANKSPHTPARLADLAPNYKQVLISSPGEVKAAFTLEGWNFFEDKMKDPSNANLGDQCVVGARNLGAELMRGPQLEGQLQTLYLRDYIRAWKDFARTTTVAPYASAADAAAKLEILASNRSPLLAAIFMIAENTNFPSTPANRNALSAAVLKKLPTGAKKAMNVAKQLTAGSQEATPGDVARLFQPARAVISLDNPDNWINEPNQLYMSKLDALRLAMQRLKDDRPSRPDVSLNKDADDAVNAGLSQATTLALKFNREGDDLKWLTDMVNSDTNRDGVDIPLRKLLEAPFREAQRFIITDISKVDSQRAGAALRQFCSRLSAFEKKFPFTPSSDVDASISEVSAVFAPQTGALATLQQQVSKLVVKQGKAWVANPASQDVMPTADFLRFMNRMQQIQDVLFADGSPQPKMHYALKPLPDDNVEAITLDIDGQKVAGRKGQSEAQQLNWPGPGADVTASVRAGGDRAFGAYSSPWAIWHWMYDADSHAPGSKTRAWSTTRQSHGQAQPAGTDAQGRPIVLRVELSELPSGVDAFERTFFDLKCPMRVTE